MSDDIAISALRETGEDDILQTVLKGEQDE